MVGDLGATYRDAALSLWSMLVGSGDSEYGVDVTMASRSIGYAVG
jgi:hypothetical protein